MSIAKGKIKNREKHNYCLCFSQKMNCGCAFWYNMFWKNMSCWWEWLELFQKQNFYSPLSVHSVPNRTLYILTPLQEIKDDPNIYLTGNYQKSKTVMHCYYYASEKNQEIHLARQMLTSFEEQKTTLLKIKELFTLVQGEKYIRDYTRKKINVTSDFQWWY